MPTWVPNAPAATSRLKPMSMKWATPWVATMFVAPVPQTIATIISQAIGCRIISLNVQSTLET